MLVVFHDFLDRLLGLSLNAEELRFRHMAWRTFIVFAVAVGLARAGARRFLAHNAGFDIMVAIVLGSVLSRGINGQAAFFPSLGASILLVGLHHALATLAFRWHWLSKLVKGSPWTLVKDGQVDRAGMARAKITDDDLDENLRLNGNLIGTGDVAEARLERNGSVSVVAAKRRERAREAEHDAERAEDARSEGAGAEPRGGARSEKPVERPYLYGPPFEGPSSSRRRRADDEGS